MFLGPVWKIPTSLSLRLYFSAAQWPSDWIPQAWSVKADASHDIFRAWDCDYTDGAPWLHPVATGFFPTAPWAHGAKDGHHLKPGRWPRVAAGAYWLFRAKPWWKGFDSEKKSLGKRSKQLRSSSVWRPWGIALRGTMRNNVLSKLNLASACRIPKASTQHWRWHAWQGNSTSVGIGVAIVISSIIVIVIVIVATKLARPNQWAHQQQQEHQSIFQSLHSTGPVAPSMTTKPPSAKGLPAGASQDTRAENLPQGIDWLLWQVGYWPSFSSMVP